MKRLSSLLLIPFFLVGSLNAMHEGIFPARPGNTSFVPGPALMFKQLYRNGVPSSGEVIIAGGVSAVERYFEGGTKAKGILSFLDSSYMQGVLLAYQSYTAACERLTLTQIREGKKRATSLPVGFSGFASVLTQNMIYKYGICALVSRLSLCKQANAMIDRGNKYHWTAMIGISLAEQLALITAENVCKQVVLKPLVDEFFRKTLGISSSDRNPADEIETPRIVEV